MDISKNILANYCPKCGRRNLIRNINGIYSCYEYGSRFDISWKDVKEKTTCSISKCPYNKDNKCKADKTINLIQCLSIESDVAKIFVCNRYNEMLRRQVVEKLNENAMKELEKVRVDDV